MEIIYKEKKKNTLSFEHLANGLLKKSKQTLKKRRKKSRRWKEVAKETWKLIVKV